MEQTPGSPTGPSSTTGSSSSSAGSASGTTPGTAQEVKAKAQQAAREVKGKAQQTAQKLKEEGKQKLESGKEGAAHKVEQLADAVNRASDELHQHQEYGLADYASQVASGINSFADTLRHRSVDDLIAETEALARRSPTIFFLGSIGVGLALSRFLKASARNTTAGEGAADLEQVEEVDVSYNSSSEWQQPEASPPLYGGQRSGASSTSTSNWSSDSAESDVDVRPGGEGREFGAGTSESPGTPLNNPPGGTYR
ncbi:MAG: hypothetical protein ABW110_09490 [Steroidobacteraceae bacterium]